MSPPHPTANTPNPKGGLADFAIWILISSSQYGLIVTAGLGRAPFLIGLLTVAGCAIGCAWLTAAMSPTMRREGIARMRALIKADFVAQPEDARWERWWNPLSKRGVLKWLGGSQYFCLTIAVLFVHPFVALVLHQSYVLLLLPFLLCHRIMRVPTHRPGSGISVWMFFLAAGGAVLVAASQYAGVDDSQFPFGASYALGLGFLALGLLINTSFTHHIPAVKQSLMLLPDNDPLITESRQRVGERAALERAQMIMCLASNATTHIISATIGIAILATFAITGWAPLPETQSPAIGGAALLMLGYAGAFGLNLFYWNRGTVRCVAVSRQAIQHGLVPAILIAAICAHQLTRISDYWFAPLNGLDTINYPILAIGIAVLISTNIGISATLKQSAPTTDKHTKTSA